MECRLVESGWLKREFRVTIDGKDHHVLYNGRELGSEHVYVDGVEAAGETSWIWFIPAFHFILGGMDASLHISVWPWLTVRSISLVVHGTKLYEE